MPDDPWSDWNAPPGERPRRFRGAAVWALAVVVAVALGGALVLRATSDENTPTAAPDGDAKAPLVNPDDIISGGPPPDGIPPIDDPKFQDPSQVDWLKPQEPVISVEIKDDARAYPLQILTWHEIVNDEVGGIPLSITFCPLCNTAYGYVRPEIEGKVTTFGTSGKLYNSNLVMYDRATDSYWPQAMGQAVTGPLTGKTLERVPTPIVSFSDFRSAFPEGQVLSRNTGHSRSYGENPYPGYDDVDNRPFLFKGEADGRLAAVERILGVESEGKVMAYPYFRLQDAARDGVTAANESVGGEPLVVLWKEGTVSALDETSIAGSRDVGAAAAFSRRIGGRTLNFFVRDGAILDEQTESTWNLLGHAVAGPLKKKKLQAVDAHDSFWFDWAAFHPETGIWRGP